MALLIGRVPEKLAFSTHPVKAMGSIVSDEGYFGEFGIKGNRQYAFQIDGQLKGNAHDYLTGRLTGLNELVLFSPWFVDPEQPGKSKVMVDTLEGQRLPIESPKLKAEILALARKGGHNQNLDFRLVKSKQGFVDNHRVSVVTTGRLKRLADYLDYERGDKNLPYDDLRFRGDVLIDSDFEESRMVGKRLKIGDLTLGVSSQIERCMVVSIDTLTGQKDPQFHAAVVNYFGNRFGVYGHVLNPQEVTVHPGDPVYLTD